MAESGEGSPPSAEPLVPPPSPSPPVDSAPLPLPPPVSPAPVVGRSRLRLPGGRHRKIRWLFSVTVDADLVAVGLVAGVVEGAGSEAIRAGRIRAFVENGANIQVVASWPSVNSWTSATPTSSLASTMMSKSGPAPGRRWAM